MSQHTAPRSPRALRPQPALHSIRALLATLFLLGASLPAQGFGEKEPSLKITKVTATPAEAAVGDSVELLIQITVNDGLHIAGALEEVNVPTTVKVDEASGFAAVGAAKVPVGDAHGESWWLVGKQEIRQTVKVLPGAGGKRVLKGSLNYGACNESVCFGPEQQAISATIQVTGGAADEGAVTQEPAAVEDLSLTIKSVEVVPAEGAVGDTVELVFKIKIHDGLHIAGALEETNIPTTVAVDGENGFSLAGEAVVPDGELPAQYGIESYWLVGEQEIRQAVKVGMGPNGVRTLQGTLNYGACDDSVCFGREEQPFSVPFTVTGGGGDAPAAPAGADAGQDGGAEGGDLAQEAAAKDPVKGGWLGLIFAGLAAGLFALVMPCTYPMIPITFSFFTKQAEARGGNVFPLALAYGLGIVAMFMLVGLAVGEIIVVVATHWLTNAIIFVAFLYFALVLFGVVNLQPPQFLQNLTGKASAKGGYLGVFGMGATLVFASFTCTAPLAGALLAYGAQGGDPFKVIVGMGAMGLMMGIPFMALALLPKGMQKMPRSGAWMNTVKVSLGFIELAAALKFLSAVDLGLDLKLLPRELFLLLWAAMFVLLGLFLFGSIRVGAAGGGNIGSARVSTGGAAMLFGFYCLFGSMGYQTNYIINAIAPDYHAPLVAARATAPAGAYDPIVQEDHERAVALALEHDKLLLVNFTGKNCANCRAMETSVFPRPEISKLLDKFIESRLHMDYVGTTELHYQLRDKYVGTRATPTYAVVDPATGERIGGLYQPDGFGPDGWSATFSVWLEKNIAAAAKG